MPRGGRVSQAYWLLDSIEEVTLEPFCSGLLRLSSTAALASCNDAARLSMGLAAVKRATDSDQVQLQVLLKPYPGMPTHFKDALVAVGKLAAPPPGTCPPPDTRKLALALRSLLSMIVKDSARAGGAAGSGQLQPGAISSHVYVVAAHFESCPQLQRLLGEAADAEIFVHLVGARPPRPLPVAGAAGEAGAPFSATADASAAARALESARFASDVGRFENVTFEEVESWNELAMERLVQTWAAELLAPAPFSVNLRLPFSAAAITAPAAPITPDILCGGESGGGQEMEAAGGAANAGPAAVGAAVVPLQQQQPAAPATGLALMRCVEVQQLLPLEPFVQGAGLCACHRMPAARIGAALLLLLLLLHRISRRCLHLPPSWQLFFFNIMS